MAKEERSVLEQRANCRVWAHLIFWNLIPFGWIISVIKTRCWIPVYIVLASMVVASVTAPKTTADDPKTAFRESIKHGQKIGAITSVIGSVVTANLIMDARNQLKQESQNSLNQANKTDENDN